MDIQKESLQKLSALFCHLHKSLVPPASGIMSCSGLIAAAELQVRLKAKI